MNMAQLMENVEVANDLIQGKPDEDGIKTGRKEPLGKQFSAKGNVTSRLTVPPFKKKPFTGSKPFAGNRPFTTGYLMLKTGNSYLLFLDRDKDLRGISLARLLMRGALRDAKKCFICEGGHFANEWPQRNSQDKDDKSDRKKKKPKPNAGLLPDLVGDQQNVVATELCKAWGKVRDQEVLVFFDPRAQENFHQSWHLSWETVLRRWIRLASWEEYLPLVEFAYNNAQHSVIGMTPFQVAYGHTPLVLTNFVLQHKVTLADQLVQEMQDILVQVRDKLVHVQQKYKKQANKHHRHAELYEDRRDDVTEEVSSSQGRQEIPMVFGVGESSRRPPVSTPLVSVNATQGQRPATEQFHEDAFRTQLVAAVNVFSQLMQNPRALFLEARLGRLQDSNAVLSHLNDFSERSFAAVANDFSKNTKLVKSMKDDLDYIFIRIRTLKARLASQYPNAFNEATKTETLDRRPDLEEPIENS
ncbi:hypothetical protein L7F22_023456 [Adiantum nelumboides]|nr:hypothetical protein [Adiantum nelumboides]